MKYSYVAVVTFFLSFNVSVWACVPTMTIEITPGDYNPKVGQNVTFTALCDSSPVQKYEWILPLEAYYISGLGTDEIFCKFSSAGTYLIVLKYTYAGTLYEESTEVQIESVSSPWYVSIVGNDNNNGQPTWTDAFRTIQMAIDTAGNGDSIFVEAGTASAYVYYENIDLKGKNIHLQSVDPSSSLTEWQRIQNTVIDGNKQGTVILFNGKEMGGCQLEGFTITEGAPAGDELALHLELDETAGTTAADSSGKERVGTLEFSSGDTTTWTSSGYIGGALEFDGDDYIEIEGYKGIVGRGARTCTAWIKTTHAPGDIMSWGDLSVGGKWIVRVNETGELRAEVSSGYIYGTTPVNDGLWHHVAVVLENDGSPDISEVKLYVDGQLETTLGDVLPCPVNTSVAQDVSIGVFQLSPVRYFQGLMDEVRIYSRALSAEEIEEQADYQDLMVDLPLDQSLSDASGNAYHGTQQGLNDSEWETGIIEDALLFNGTDDYVSLPAGIIDPAQTAFSVFAWVRLDNKESGSYQVIFQQTDVDAEHPGRCWLYRGADDTLCSSLGVGAPLTSSTQPIFTTTGQWYHVGLTYDGQTVTLYADGAACGTSTQSAESCTGQILLGIHKNTSNTATCWDGLMDEVQIFRRALTAEEVSELTGAGFLQGYWKLDGDLNDSTLTTAHNGTWYGTSGYTDGYVDQAITLDGSSYVEIANYTGITGAQSRTSAAWINIGELASAGTILSWGANDPSTGNKWLFRVEKSTSSGIYRFGVGVWGGYYVWSDYILNPSQWYHVAASLDGTTINDINLYVNGTEVSYYNRSTNITLQTAQVEPVHIGANLTSGSMCNYFKGRIDDARIYSRALTASEIYGLADRKPRLAAHWKLDGNAEDSTEIAHDGTLQNNTTPQWEDGICGQALRFDGVDDCIEITGYKGVSGGQARTVSAWIKANPNVDQNQIIVSWGEVVTGRYWKFWIQKNMGTYGSLCVGISGGYYAAGSTDLRDGKWHHVMAVMEEGSNTKDIKLYVDGKEEPHSAESSYVVQTGGVENVHIGCETNDVSYFAGVIDDVRIYNYALATGEVQEVYKTRFADGGGIKGQGSSADFSKCIIKGNASEINGGGVFNFNGRLENCIISGNTAAGLGGGFAKGYADIVNCTIAENTASQGGGVYDCDGFVKNCIIWGNNTDQNVSVPYISYSCVQNWTGGGTGNITDNPIFVNPANNDYHLNVHSKCIDAGDENSVYSNEPEDNGDRINMGAYGNTDEAACYDASGSGADSDGDGLKDWMEIYVGTDVDNPDSDGDGLIDGDEVEYNSTIGEFVLSSDPRNPDTDNDGMTDGWEVLNGLDVYDASDAQIDPDGDGMTNLEEFWYNSIWNSSIKAWEYNHDFDDDSISACYDNDDDNDGLDDGWEINNDLNPRDTSDGQTGDPENMDLDNDGVDNVTEETNGTNPYHHNELGMIIEYDYDNAGRIEEQRITHGQGMVFSATVNNYDALGRQIVQRQYQFDYDAETYANNVTGNDIVTLTVYDVLGDAEMTVRKISRESGDVVDVVQDGDLVTMNDTRYEDVDVPSNGILEQVSETTVGHYVASAGTINADSSVASHIIYFDRADSNLDGIYCYDQSIAPAHDSSGTRAVTTSYYDRAGRAYSVMDARGNYRTMTYDTMGQLIRQVSWDSQNTQTFTDDVPVMQTRSVYDNLGRTTQNVTMKQAAAASNSNVVNEVEASLVNGDIIANYIYDYDFPTGGIERNYPGQLVAKTIYYGTSASAATSYYDYDAIDRQYKVTDPANNTTELFYNVSNQVIRSIQTELHPSGPSYNLVLTNDSYYDYDSVGRIAYVITKPLDSDYDALVFDDSQITATFQDFSLQDSWMMTTFEYDAAGRKVAETKPNGVKTETTYWAAGQKKTEVTDADGGDATDIKQTTEWDYDRVGRLAVIAGNTDESNPNTWQETEYAYNDLSSVVDIYYPDYDVNVSATKGHIHYDYFANGQVRQRTDQRGIVTTYAYNATGVNLLSKMATVDSVATTESFSYDAMGRMATATKTTGGTSISHSDFAYEDTGKLDYERQSLFGGAYKEVSYNYDTAGFRTQTTYPDGMITLYRAPTWNDQTDTLSRGGIYLVNYDYLGSRVFQRSYPTPSVATVYGYDGYGRLEDVVAGTLVDFHYDYVSYENNISMTTFNHRSGMYDEYAYDDIDRLTGVGYHVSGTDAFTMDDLGNRTGSQTLHGEGTVNFAVDPQTNRYTAIGGTPLAYDDAGSLTRDKAGYSYLYDYENRIVKIEKPDGADEGSDPDPVAEFAYDTQGRRIRVYDAVAPTTTLYYYSDNWQVLAEYNGSGVQQAYYVFGNYIDEALLMNRGGSDKYYLHDHLYSPVSLLDNSGNVIERYEYDAYGKVQVLSPNYELRTTSLYSNPYTFTGRELDVFDSGSLKIMYYRARTYDPETGRFMQWDPLCYVNSTNLYEYVRSNPVIYVDYMGLFSIDVIGTPAYERNSCLDGEPRGKGCISNFWMSVAVNLTPAERKEIVSSPKGQGFSVLRKFARWRQVDCESGVPSDVGREEATFIKDSSVPKEGADDILENGPAGTAGTGIRDMVNPEQIDYVSPYYSALIAKELKRPASKCCSRGDMTVIAEFFINQGAKPANDMHYSPPNDKTISWPEYAHAWWSTKGRVGLDLFGGSLISRGTLRVDIKWDCKNNVSATAESNVPYSSTGNLTRTGREQEWIRHETARREGVEFPIPF